MIKIELNSANQLGIASVQGEKKKTLGIASIQCKFGKHVFCSNKKRIILEQKIILDRKIYFLI